MTVTIPVRYEYGTRTGIALQEAVTGESGGIVREMLDNATYCYSSTGRRTLLEFAPASSSPPALGYYTTTVALAGTAETRFRAWVEVSEDTATLIWTAWTTDCHIVVKAYDEVTAATLLDTSTDTSILTGDELTGTVDVSGRAGTYVLLTVDYKAGDVAFTNAKLYNFTCFEKLLLSGDLPT
jgi:hypothetical protein